MDNIHSIDKRLAVIEERSRDLHEIKASVKIIERDMSNLKIKVGIASASISLVAALIFELVKKGIL